MKYKVISAIIILVCLLVTAFFTGAFDNGTPSTPRTSVADDSFRK